MWNANTAPTGWALCDGQNGTPDLRDKFVLAAGNNTSVGDTAAGTVASGPAHVISAYPQHSHSSTWTGSSATISISGDTSGGGGKVYPVNPHDPLAIPPQPAPALGWVVSTSFNSDGDTIPTANAHNHTFSGSTNYTPDGTVTISPEGTNGGVNYIPPCYVLSYIMRIS